MSAHHCVKRKMLRKHYLEVPEELWEPKARERTVTRVNPEISEVVSEHTLDRLGPEMAMLAKMHSALFIPEDDDIDYMDKMRKRDVALATKYDLIAKMVRQATAANLNEVNSQNMTMFEKKKSKELTDRVTKKVDDLVKQYVNKKTVRKSSKQIAEENT